jgi:acetyl-CoA acetyltransferase
MAPLADASCLLVLASQRKLQALNARPLAQVLGHCTVGADPAQPALAVNQLLPCLESMLERHTAEIVANGTNRVTMARSANRATIAVELMESFSAQAILNRQALVQWEHQPFQTKAWAQDIWPLKTSKASKTSRASKSNLVSADAILDINPDGGLLALGHPIGASGAILVARLAHRMEPNQLGVAIIPAAGGLASAMLLKGYAPPRPR